MSKVVFSGIQPSGDFHIGNYIGAIRQWVKNQEDGLNIFCIVDMHAITVPQDPKVLQEKTLDLAAVILAAGIDPDKSILFIQSHNPDHANLAWVLNCMATTGQLERMTQFKDKSDGKESVSMGLFDYPVLMAADILLYDTTEVPVGEDQKQHVELTRDLAQRFNHNFGDTFVLPNAVIPKIGGRVMSLIDPTKKMSKSDANRNSAVYLLDSREEVESKIMSATTDSEAGVRYDWGGKPGISNLLEIYSQFAGEEVSKTEDRFKNGASYKVLKQSTAEVVNDFLKPFQEKYKNIRESNNLNTVLNAGAEKARKMSETKLREVYKKVGFINNG